MSSLAGAATAAEGDADLKRALEWSVEVNRSIGEIVKEVPPFPFVRESLEFLTGKADVMVVSATPGEALEREWAEHGLTPTDAYCLVSTCPDFRINVYQMCKIGKLSFVAGAEIPTKYLS